VLLNTLPLDLNEAAHGRNEYHETGIFFVASGFKVDAYEEAIEERD